jgi:tetratricopeptide (TPR) repeat protein
VWYTKARYLEKMERLDDALRALDRALELAPQNPSYREAKRSIEAKKKSRQRMRQERLETPGQNSRSANSSPYNATGARNKPHPNPGT